MKKSDFSTILSIILLLLCSVTIILAFIFEMGLKENLFTLSAGLFMVFFGLLLAISTKMKWTEYAQRHGK